MPRHRSAPKKTKKVKKTKKPVRRSRSARLKKAPKRKPRTRRKPTSAAARKRSAARRAEVKKKVVAAPKMTKHRGSSRRSKYLCASFSLGPSKCYPNTDEGLDQVFDEAAARGDAFGIPVAMWDSDTDDASFLSRKA